MSTSPKHSLRQRLGWLIGLGFLILLQVSCQARTELPPLDLTLQVTPSSQPGRYTLAGQTTLPDETVITVMAQRNLRVNTLSPRPVILDRQRATVQRGQWQATLNLYHPDRAGELFETWQLIGTQPPQTLSPESSVRFVALLELPGQPPVFEAWLEEFGESLRGPLVRYTEESELYLEASQTLTLPIPSGTVAADSPLPGDPLGSWTDRAQLPPDSAVTPSAPAPNQDRGTKIPLSPEQRLR